MKPNSRTVSTILKKLRTLYPDAQCALLHKNPFQLLVATILSAQCTDKRVNMITPELFKKAGTPMKMAGLRLKELEGLIKTCGLYQSKAKNLMTTARILVEEHGSKVPNNMEALTKLAGVGRKTANVVLSNAFGVPAIAVDTHVFRVAQRLGLAKAKTPEQVERQLMAALPKKAWTEAHHMLILHGRNLCRARNPLCGPCPLKPNCPYYQSTSA